VKLALGQSNSTKLGSICGCNWGEWGRKLELAKYSAAKSSSCKCSVFGTLEKQVTCANCDSVASALFPLEAEETSINGGIRDELLLSISISISISIGFFTSNGFLNTLQITHSFYIRK
jgi:hypothetical protein